MRLLRRKLSLSLLALAVLGLLVVGVTGYTVVQWRATEQTLERHYVRSLRLQEVRALIFEAFQEVPDAVIGYSLNPREEYLQRLESLEGVFEEWESLAEDDAERAEVVEVRAAAERVNNSAMEIFALTQSGQGQQAAQLLENVGESAFETFDALTTAAVLTDREKRQAIQTDAAAARRNATMVLAVSAVGVLSLVLLVGAYLTGSIFAPMRRLRDGLRAVNSGDTPMRLREDGEDEIAELNREFNSLAAALRQGARPAIEESTTTVEDARLVLGRQVSGLREEVQSLGLVSGDGRSGAVADLLAKVDAVAATVDRIGGLAYPVDLRLTAVEPAALLHEVLDRVYDEVVRRSVSTEIDVAATMEPLRVDRERLREALGELVRNALEALPSRGGRLQLRARPVFDDGISSALEIEDDGSGIAQEDIAWLYDGSRHPRDARGAGLQLATSVVEQHGGQLQLQPLPEGGTIARILLPAADAPRYTGPKETS